MTTVFAADESGALKSFDSLDGGSRWTLRDGGAPDRCECVVDGKHKRTQFFVESNDSVYARYGVCTDCYERVCFMHGIGWSYEKQRFYAAPPILHASSVEQRARHISDVEDMSAAGICAFLARGNELPDDTYNNNIVSTARALVDDGHGDARYMTQYESGTTYWQLGDRTLRVQNGEVQDV